MHINAKLGKQGHKEAGRAQKGCLGVVEGRADMKSQLMPNPLSELPLVRIS